MKIKPKKVHKNLFTVLWIAEESSSGSKGCPELTNVELQLFTEAAVQQLQLITALEQLL
jgi:hypothetical protein